MATSYFTVRVMPAEVRKLPAADRLAFNQVVADLVLKRKDFELSRGLNAKGEPLPGVKAETRKNRKSEMTPTGKGDPRAPYLMPGRGLSRTRSLLTARAYENYVVVGWRFDAWTGDQWGRVLAAHARRGEAYNVVGLSPRGVAWVAAQAQARWRRIRAGKEPMPSTIPMTPAAPITIPLVGRTNLDYATEGIGGTLEQARRAIAEGRSPGFLSQAEWQRYFRQSRPNIAQARPGTSYSVRTGQSNVILQHVWGTQQQAPPASAAKKAAMGPKTPPKAPVKAKPPAPARDLHPDLANVADVVEIRPGNSDAARKSVAVGVRAIDKVHGVTGMGLVGVDGNVRYKGLEAPGVYRPEDRAIGMNQRAEDASWVFIHEFGHAIDYQALTEFKWGLARDSDSVVNAWAEAASGSRKFVELEKAFEQAEYGSYEYNHLKYLLSPVELWARAYTQYIALKSGDPDLARSFEAAAKADTTFNAWRWDDDDFAPIAAAFDRLFESRRWLR